MHAFLGIAFCLLALHSQLGVAQLTPDRENGYFCSEEAMNPFPGDCRKYIVCIRNKDGSFSGAVSVCHEGEAFDKRSRACVPADQVTCSRRVARQLVASPPKSGSPSNGSSSAADSCNDAAISCVDCTTLRVCSYTSKGFTKMQDINCSEGNQNLFCDSDLLSCTEKIPVTCDVNYQCTSSGYFPDATDCSLYHYCYEAGTDKLAAEAHYCESGQVYSTSQKICVVRKTAADCHAAKCPANKTLVTSFPGEPSFYVVCIAGNPQFVYYCGDNKEFDAMKGVCEVKCKQAGRIPSGTDCMGFYECTANKVGGGFTAALKKCPLYTKFDSATQACVPGKCP
ncbi:uncharacterized protein LOC124171428 [Ischnura elegans]|uniref:uncharacterized protein LOC124171428 n=1 Tax=Ischnura elegans TaxID=197161 RepID=UPI001ED8ABE7|nr:uncharacterized protein LOC124171428 [Ischnura elegans]